MAGGSKNFSGKYLSCKQPISLLLKRVVPFYFWIVKLVKKSEHRGNKANHWTLFPSVPFRRGKLKRKIMKGRHIQIEPNPITLFCNANFNSLFL